MFRDLEVPQVPLPGNRAAIEKTRRKRSGPLENGSNETRWYTRKPPS